MSAETSVVTLIMSVADLIATLKELRLTHRELKRMKTENGQEHDVDLVVEGPHGRQIGFQKTKEGHYRAIGDAGGLSAGQVKAQADCIQQIVQRYAYKKVTDQLKAQGYVIAQEEQKTDNTIRLVVRKWS